MTTTRKMLVIVLVILSMSTQMFGQISQRKDVFQVANNYDFMSIAPSKMNVLYVGLDNPVDIVVMGYSDDMIDLEIDSSASIERLGNCQYNVRVGKVSLVVIKVFRKFPKRQLLGERVFRVKRVPDPVARIAGVSRGSISKSLLMASSAIIPVMENFDFDLNFEIVSYTLSAACGGDLIEMPGIGSVLSPNMLKTLQAINKGQRIYIEDIKAKGPDGSLRTLAPITLKII